MNHAIPTPQDLARSVLAVPPLARRPDLSLDTAANRRLIRHIEAGGIRTLLYGGNANLYHQPLSEFEPMLQMLAEAAGPDTLVIPSIGPDYGKMIEQAPLLRRSPFPTAMVLPMSGVTSPEGVRDGLQRVADAAQRPLTLYLRSEATLELASLQALVDSGHLWCVKYAIGRDQNGTPDRFLDELCQRIGAERVVSGMGERPVLGHVGPAGLAGNAGLPSFTTGCGCIAPRTCMALLAALQRGDAATAQRLQALFLPLEDLRDAVSLVRVLHDAVTWSGVADMGAQLPLLSATPAAWRQRVQAAAQALLAAEAQADMATAAQG